MKIELHELHDRYSLPPISGIYFIFSSDKLLYIGKANNISNRLTMSRLIKEYLKKHGITHIYIFPYHEDDIYKIEADLIRMFSPPLNNIGITTNKDRWRTLYEKRQQRKCFNKEFINLRPEMN